MNESTTPRKIPLVTRANKGIGRASAEGLAALGATVLVGARDAARGEEVATAVRAAGGDAHAVAPDVSDPATVRAAARGSRSAWAASMSWPGRPAGSSPEEGSVPW